MKKNYQSYWKNGVTGAAYAGTIISNQYDIEIRSFPVKISSFYFSAFVRDNVTAVNLAKTLEFFEFYSGSGNNWGNQFFERLATNPFINNLVFPGSNWIPVDIDLNVSDYLTMAFSVAAAPTANVAAYSYFLTIEYEILNPWLNKVQ